MTEVKSGNKCSCGSTDVLIFSCSGGSNVGQIANEVAKKLMTQGKGKMYCLAGIGGHISGITESTRAARKIVAIDGCMGHCAKKTMEHAGFDLDEHVVITDHNIQKSHDLIVSLDDINKVVNYVSKII